MNEMPKLIAEIGCNHRGDLETAKEMIKISALFCRADVVKFQKRNPKELLSEAEYNAPHPNPANAFGETYGEHREFLEMSAEEHRILKHTCEEWGVTYSTSVWDVTSAREIIALSPDLIKVPSACNLNWPMLDLLITDYSGEVHLSFGMTTQEEEEKIIDRFEKGGRAKDLIVYSCTSGYPVDFKDLCLKEITRLLDLYGDRVKTIGFSGHHLGIAADMAALALGATWFERHFTLDRTWKGTDHAASLEPDGLRKLARDLNHVSLALTHKNEEILPVEIAQRAKLKKEQDHRSVKKGDHDISTTS